MVLPNKDIQVADCENSLKSFKIKKFYHSIKVSIPRVKYCKNNVTVFLFCFVLVWFFVERSLNLRKGVHVHIC